MSPDEQAEFLSGLGLSPDGASLAAPAKPQAAKRASKAQVKDENPHTMPVTDIVFDPALLDEYKLDKTDMTDASRFLFDLYKSPGRDRDRNSLLHRRITEFINQVRKARDPQPRDGYIKEKVKAGKEQRDLAQVLAAHNMTADDLAIMLDALAAAREGGQA